MYLAYNDNGQIRVVREDGRLDERTGIVDELPDDVRFVEDEPLPVLLPNRSNVKYDFTKAKNGDNYGSHDRTVVPFKD